MPALVCDVDGVLIRSMERNYEAYREVFAGRGVALDPMDVYANEGRGARQLIARVAEERRLGWSEAEVEQVTREHRARFDALGALPLYPGVPELLAAAKARGWKVAAVSGNYRDVLERHLAPVRARLDVLVTSEDVAHTKPHPEPFLAALAKLHIRAADAVVVENAVLGIQSAKAAGIRVVAVASTMPPEALREADAVVPGIPQVWPAVQGLLGAAGRGGAPPGEQV
ncbi:MAG: HAD family phosphatase [Halobacteriales archaeon]|nr:HAD family phosphatase [Halobacteriales archaeon]